MNEVSVIGKVFGKAFHSKSVSKFTIGTNMGHDPKTHGEKTALVPCTAFRLSEMQKRGLYEGDPIAVKGYVSESSYQKNGRWVKQTSVYVYPKSLRTP